jgi:hypothetical protein
VFMKTWNDGNQKIQTLDNKALAENSIRIIMNYLNDTNKKNRKKDQICRCCYYIIGKIAGQAFTTSKCVKCGKEMVFPSTYIDTLCLECAAETKSCKHCGGKMD